MRRARQRRDAGERLGRAGVRLMWKLCGGPRIIMAEHASSYQRDLTAPPSAPHVAAASRVAAQHARRSPARSAHAGKHAREPAGLPRCARTLGQPYGPPDPPAAAVHALCPPRLDPTRRRRGRLRRPVRGGAGPLPHLAPPAGARPRWVQRVRRQPEAHRTAGLCEGGDTDAAGASRHQPPEAGPQASSRWPHRVPRAPSAVRALHHASPLARP